MGDTTGIEWTDKTFNPWWGCTRVSPGCDNCYAERDARRFSPQQLWGPGAERREFDDKHWEMPVRWNRHAERTKTRIKVFCASMADVFDNHPVAVATRPRLWELMMATPWLDWQVLTKRIGNVKAMVPAGWLNDWPKHVWLGISVVNQEEANRDIPKLEEIRARVRFLSCEPLLGRIDLCEAFGMWWNQTMQCFESHGDAWKRPVDWVIVGGESGPWARPMRSEWVRHLRDVCNIASVPFLFKQWGEWLYFDAGSPCLHMGEGADEHWARVDGKEYHFREIVPAGNGWAVRVGRKNAGRMLEGVVHDGYPS